MLRKAYARSRTLQVCGTFSAGSKAPLQRQTGSQPLIWLLGKRKMAYHLERIVLFIRKNSLNAGTDPKPGLVLWDLNEVLEVIVGPVELKESIAIGDGLLFAGFGIQELKTEDRKADNLTFAGHRDKLGHLGIARSAHLARRNINLFALRAADAQDLVVVAQLLQKLAAIKPYGIVIGLCAVAGRHGE